MASCSSQFQFRTSICCLTALLLIAFCTAEEPPLKKPDTSYSSLSSYNQSDTIIPSSPPMKSVDSLLDSMEFMLMNLKKQIQDANQADSKGSIAYLNFSALSDFFKYRNTSRTSTIHNTTDTKAQVNIVANTATQVNTISAVNETQFDGALWDDDWLVQNNVFNETTGNMNNGTMVNVTNNTDMDLFLDPGVGLDMGLDMDSDTIHG
jgi:hypothetical protein